MITTMVGNFPKVAETHYGKQVIGAISRWQRKELSDAGLEQVFQEVTRAVIGEQVDAGLDVVTDGQIRWEDLVTPIARRLDGFEIEGLTRYFDNNTYYRRPILRKAPVRRGPILVRDYRFARSCTDRQVKAVLPGPYTFVTLCEDRHYKNVRPFLRAMAEILNEEAHALATAGASVIQFDEPALGFGKPPTKQAIEAINIAAKGLKSSTALYTYFGHLNGILPALQQCRVDLIGVDVVSDPKALAAVTRVKWKKALAIGCLDGRNTKLESVKELHRVFDAVKKTVPADRLSINPSCGLEFLPFQQAQQKLKRLVEAVRTYRSR